MNRLALLAATTLLAAAVDAQPYGIDTRESNTGIVINNLPPPVGSYTVQNVFPSVSFTSPVHVTNAGDGTNRVFVVEQPGRIRVYDADDSGTPTISTFLDIQGVVRDNGSEQGLLSVAFHPNYASNGKFYVYYTSEPSGATTVSEFINSNPSGNPPSTPTERILLTQSQPFTNHNGGQLQFGEDGYLYIGLGDGGSANDPNDNGQRMTTFLGKILRIDVDGPFDPGKQYRVPPDNPLIYAGGSTQNIIIESRQPGGALTTPAQGYEEFGDFTDSALKSTFAGSGLTGTGSRASSNTPIASRARFTPNITTSGLYNIYVTTTNNSTANAANTQYIINYDEGQMTYTVALTAANTGNQWRLIRRNVPMSAGGENWVEIIENGPQSNLFFSDAVRFERVPGVLPEIYAYGLRNPWRFSPDLATGRIWIGDVGQGDREEVSILKPGGNYGWRHVEGNICTPAITSSCDLTGYVDPVHTYGHSGSPSGCSITGGYVYRGPGVPSLYGRYLYADYCSGWIRGFLYNGIVASNDIQIVASAGNVTSFGQMENGELLLVANGHVKRIVQTGTPPVSDLPTKLSDMPALLSISLGGNATGVIPYEPQEQFWTDGAIKTRHIAIPGVQQATYTASAGWNFPNGTTIVKNYRLPLIDGSPASAVRVETRLLVKNSGDWTGYSYRWNPEQTDAFLLTAAETREFTIQTSGGPINYTWQFPSSSQCLQCHTVAANRTVGLSTIQMNCDYLYPVSGVTDNQLRTLDHISFFDAPLPGLPNTLPSMPDSKDTGYTLEQRAKSYLHANCSHCHMPGGPTPSSMDLRYQTPVASMNVLGVPPSSGDFGIPDAALVKPGVPDESIIVYRMESLQQVARMPPLTSTRVDTVGAQLIRDWIGSLSSSSTPNWDAY